MDQEVKKSLLEKEYVIDYPRHRPLGVLTRIWGMYAEPIPFYIQVSNQDTVSVIAGNLGIADIKIGDSNFDGQFVVRSNDANLATELLSTELRNELLNLENIRFRTGSINTLLTADHFPEIKKDRDLRNVWMIDIAGKLEQSQTDPLLHLAQRISDAVKTISLKFSAERNLRTKTFEGR